MKPNDSRLTLALSILFGSCLFILISPQSVSLQITCPQIPAYIPSAPYLGTWAEVVAVQVNIDPSFSDLAKNAIRAALSSWNVANGFSGNCSHVTFATPTSNPSPLNPIPGGYAVQITNTPPTANPGAAAETTYQGDGNSRTYAEIRMDPRMILNFPEVWQHVAAHELGHTFGMGDCPSCPCTATLMSYQACSFSTLPTGPTSCDNPRVKEIGQYCLISDPGDGGGGCYVPPGCEGSYDYRTCTCWATPILIEACA